MRFWTAVSLCVRAQIRVPGGLSATRNWRDIVQNSNRVRWPVIAN